VLLPLRVFGDETNFACSVKLLSRGLDPQWKDSHKHYTDLPATSRISCLLGVSVILSCGHGLLLFALILISLLPCGWLGRLTR